MNQKDFSSLVKSLLKGDSIDVQNFWKALQQNQSDDNAYCYCLSIFESLSSPNRTNFINQNEQRLYCTLLAIEYYKNRRPKSQEVIKQCRKFMEKGGIIGHPKWILNLFMNPLKDDFFSQNFLSRLLYIPRQLDWSSSIIVQLQSQIKQGQIYVRKLQDIAKKQNFYQRAKMYSYPPLVGIQTKGISLSYVCFLDFVRRNFNEMNDDQYKYMINCFKALIHSIKVNEQSIEYLCILLHFCINCITYYSCNSQPHLKQLLMLASHLKNCWGVIGQLGTQLFQLLYKQLKIPGNAFRKKLRYDFPSLDIKQCNYLNKYFYFVTDGQDSFSRPEDRSLHNLRKLMIWHIMKVAGFDNQQMNQYIELLRGAANDSTYQLYFKCMKIIDISAGLEVYDKIKQVIKYHLLQLLKQAKTKFQQQGKRASKQQSEQFQFFLQQQNSLNIFVYPLYEIIYSPLIDFANTEAQINFYSILKRYRTQNSHLVFYMNKISIIFYGVLYDFVNIIQVLSRFLEEADIEQTRQLQIFYIPKPQSKTVSQIASYLASKDIWYRRFIYNIFKLKVLFPYLQLNDKNKKLFPSYVMNKSVHMYIRQAKRVFNLRVYKCLLKLKDEQNYTVIYFTSSLLLGTFAEAEIIRLNKLKNQQKWTKYEDRSTVDIIKEKLSKKPRLIADISIQYLQPLNNEVQKKSQNDLVFQDLQVCNLPRQYFFGNRPDPLGNSLKLAILTQANSKLFWKQFFSQENFRENKSTQQLCHAFKQLFICYSIKSMTIKNKSQQSLFKIVIDGVAFENVEKVLILSPNSTYGLPISLPILTFLPFK